MTDNKILSDVNVRVNNIIFNLYYLFLQKDQKQLQPLLQLKQMMLK